MAEKGVNNKLPAKEWLRIAPLSSVVPVLWVAFFVAETGLSRWEQVVFNVSLPLVLVWIAAFAIDNKD